MGLDSKTPEPWTIVLAAGEGLRLQAFTRTLHGEDLPKQFAVIVGRSSLLQNTLTRVRQWSSAARTVVVVAEEREALARRQLERFGGLDIVAQPRNLGTGPGLLLPLMHVLARDPHALVVVMPSDHHVRDEEPFQESVTQALAIAQRSGDLVLIGALPDRPDPDYGWIITAPAADGSGARVERFEEKPPAPVAAELFRTGALWNSFVMAGPAVRFWELARRHLSEQASLFESYAPLVGAPEAPEHLAEVYSRLPPADFSRNVLHCAHGLRSVTLAPCGWSDWGTPDRVLESLRGSVHLGRLVQRLNAHSRVLVRPSPSRASDS